MLIKRNEVNAHRTKLLTELNEMLCRTRNAIKAKNNDLTAGAKLVEHLIELWARGFGTTGYIGKDSFTVSIAQGVFLSQIHLSVSRDAGIANSHKDLQPIPKKRPPTVYSGK